MSWSGPKEMENHERVDLFEAKETEHFVTEFSSDEDIETYDETGD